MAYGQLQISPGAAAELVGVFKRELQMCRLTADERLLVVTDSAFNPIYAAACMGAGLDIGAETVEVTIAHGQPWSENALAGAFGSADLIVYSTTHALHYSEAMRKALTAGKRALMAVVPLHVLERRIADADVIRRTKLGASLVEKASRIRITSDVGTDLVMEKTGRPGVASYGAADMPGHLDFWGAGFFQTAELEGTMEGTLVLNTGDLVFHFARYIEQPVTITFREGCAVSFKGGLDAFLIRNYLESFRDKKAFLAGHIACGTDRRAIWTAEIAQFPVSGGGGADAEAYYGNVQVEIGSNNDAMFRGKNVSGAHLGLCLLNCSLYLDDVLVLDHGEFILDELRVNP